VEIVAIGVVAGYISSVYLDPDEALAQVEADVRRSDARAAQMPAFEAAIAQVRGKASSKNRDIIVQVDSAGRVVELRLTDHALSRGAQRLSYELMATIRDAEADVQQKTLAAVSDLLGADDPIVAQLGTAGGGAS
jgi:DNA-binding protein YbaB